MTTERLVTDDYRCQRCGGRVGATSRHCMHCEADLDTAGGDARAGDAPALRDALTREVGDRDARPPSEGTRITAVVVGVLAGGVLAVATFLATMVPLGDGALIAAPVACLVGTVAIARQRSPSDAVGLAALLLAATALVFPLGLSVPTFAGQLAAGRAGTAAVTLSNGLVAAVFFLPVWAGLGVLGWHLRR